MPAVSAPNKVPSLQHSTSLLSNVKNYTTKFMMAEGLPAPVGVVTITVGHVALALLSMFTLGAAIPLLTRDIWEQFGKEKALKNLATITSGTPKANLENAPKIGYLRIPSFAKVSPGVYQTLIQDKETGHILYIKFTIPKTGPISCSHPEFMKDGLPNISLLSRAFSKDPKVKKDCRYTGYQGERTQLGVQTRNALAATQGFFTKTVPYAATQTVIKAYHNKLATVSLLAGATTVGVYAYRNGIPSYEETKSTIHNLWNDYVTKPMNRSIRQHFEDVLSPLKSRVDQLDRLFNLDPSLLTQSDCQNISHQLNNLTQACMRINSYVPMRAAIQA